MLRPRPPLKGETLPHNSRQFRGANLLTLTIGRLSRLDSMQMQEIAKDAERRREERVTLLEMALNRIDVGTYGKCETCKGTIPIERLKITPEASRCGKCAV